VKSDETDPRLAERQPRKKNPQQEQSLMTFNIVAMICIAGMSPAECGPEPGFSRDVAVIGQVSNELWCLGEAQMDAAKSAPFRNLGTGEFIKIMCVRNG
jgi:hypothetical protein